MGRQVEIADIIVAFIARTAPFMKPSMLDRIRRAIAEIVTGAVSWLGGYACRAPQRYSLAGSSTGAHLT